MMLPPSLGQLPTGAPPPAAPQAPTVVAMPQMTAEQRAALAQMAAAEQNMRALVSNAGPQGQALLDTVVGRLPVKLAVPVKTTDVLLLQITTTAAGQPTAKLLAVNGQPVAQPPNPTEVSLPQTTADQRAVLIRMATAGQTIRALVSSAGQGDAVLDTVVGRLPVRLGMAVKTTDVLQLQLTTNAAGQPAAKLLAVNGQAVAPQPAQTQATNQPQPQAGTAVRVDPGRLAAAAGSTSGTLMAQVMLPGSGAEALPSGTTLLVRLLSIGGQPVAQQSPTPQAPVAPQAPAPQVQAPQPSQPTAASPQPAAQPQTPTQPQPAQPQPAQPQTPVPPQAATPAPPSAPAPQHVQAQPQQVAQPDEPELRQPAPPQTQQTAAQAPARSMQAVVAANSHLGRPLVQTPVGLVALDTPMPLLGGTKLVLELVGQPVLPSAPAPTTVPTLPAGLRPMPGPLPSFFEALQVLRQSAPLAAEKLLARLPQKGPEGAAAVIGIAGALRSGNARNWLGEDTIEELSRAGRSDLVQRLTDEVDQLAGQLRRPAGNEWQSSTLPFWTGQELAAVRMVVRRDQDESGRRDKADAGTRFVVEVELSQLGPLQLDGLVRRAAKRFDLIVRTNKPLELTMRGDIEAIFARALDGIGMTGQAIFQAGGAFVDIPKDTPVRSPGSGVMA